MKLKTTIILLIAAAIGISYIFLYEKKQLPQEEWERLQKKAIPDFQSSIVKKIEMHNEGGKLVLEKNKDNFWYIVEPQKLRADNSEVHSILSEFEFMNKVGSFKKEGEKPFDLKDYGLDVPKTSITMYTDVPAKTDKIQVSGPRDKYTVYVGQKLAAGNNVYMKLDTSDEVIVVPGTLYEKANKNVLDLRSKWVFTFDKDAVDGLQVKTDDYTIVCNKKSNNSWRIVEPVHDVADMEKIKDILGKFKGLQVDREAFLTEDAPDLSKFGLNTPRFTVTVAEKGVTQTIIFGNTLDNLVYVKRLDEPTIFFLKDTILADLSRKPNDLRDRKVVRFESIGAYGINKLEIKTPTDTVNIEKTLDLDWTITQPVKVYADQDTVKNFIEKIKTLEIEDFVSDKPADLSAYGLKDPVFEIAVTKEGDKELARFYVGNALPDGGRCYVKRVGEEPVYTVPTVEFYNKIDNVLLTFRDRLVCEFNRDHAKKLVIEKSDRTFVCGVSGKKDSEGKNLWELTKPVQVAANMDAINEIVWDMAFLKAENYVTKAPKDLAAYGLDNPAIKVSVTYEIVDEPQPEDSGRKKEEKQEPIAKPKEPVEKKIETRTLLIGKRVKDGDDKVNSYCKFSDSDLVFELSWPKIRNFNAELAPTKVLDFERTNVVKLSLTYPDRSIQLDKTNNVWRMKNHEQETVQGRETDYFIRNLEELKGSYVEQYQATNLTQFSLDTPQLVISVGLEAGESVLYIGKKKNDRSYYVKNKDKDYIYVVDSETVSKLMKKEDDFTKVTAETIPDMPLGVPGEMPMGAGPHGKMPGHAPHGGGMH